MKAINDDGKAHAPCLQPLRASYRRCAHGTTARGTISAIAAACAVTSVRSTNAAMSPSIFRRRVNFSTNLRAAAPFMRIASSNASGAAALPRASRFSATICRRAAPMCARFAGRRAAPRGRFQNRLSNRETPCAEWARRANLGFVENARCAVAYRVATNQSSCFEVPFTSASTCFDTMKSFCRCTSKGLP